MGIIHQLTSQSHLIYKKADEIVKIHLSVIDQFWKLFASIFAVFLATISIFPIYVLLNSAVRPYADVVGDPLQPAFLEELTWENFIYAWQEGGFDQYVFNSVFIVVTSVIAIILICSLAAYALMYMDVPHSKKWVMFLFAGFLLPSQVLFVPLFLMMNEIGMINRYPSLIIVYIGFGISFSVFFFYQFYQTVPHTYREAAKIDGASEISIFLRIYFPLSLPVVYTIAIVQFVWLWNEFLYALTFLTSDEKRTLPAGLVSFQSVHLTDWASLTAGVVIAVIPTVIIFLLFQKYFIRGFTGGRVE